MWSLFIKCPLISIRSVYRTVFQNFFAGCKGVLKNIAELEEPVPSLCYPPVPVRFWTSILLSFAGADVREFSLFWEFDNVDVDESGTLEGGSTSSFLSLAWAANPAPEISDLSYSSAEKENIASLHQVCVSL